MRLAASFCCISLVFAFSGCITPPNKSYAPDTVAPTPPPTISLDRPFQVIGHRGAAGYAPENTLPSFEKAKSFGLYDVELDIQVTKDSQLVLFHDADLSPKTALKGKIKSYTWEQLQSAEIGSWFDREHQGMPQKFAGTKLVLLKDVLVQFGEDFFYHIEIKATDKQIPEILLTLLNEKRASQNVIVTSFYKEQLVRVRELSKTIRIGYLIDDKLTPEIGTEIRFAKEAGFQQVAVRASLISQDNVTLARDLGLNIRSWGIKKREDMERAIGAGAEGMTIDWPDWLLHELVKKVR